MGEDVDSLRQELESSKQALATVQRNYDDFLESSRELEEELEAELGRTQDEVSDLTRRLADVAGRLGEQQGKNRALSSELAAAQAETVRLREAAVRAAAEKAGLEQTADELEAKVRAAVAAEDDARHKLDLAIEEKIFVSNDLEDLRAETLRTEQTLRSELQDVRHGLGRGGDREGQTTPPLVTLPKTVSSLTEPGDHGDEAATVVEGSELRLATNGHGSEGMPTAGDDYPEAADEAADELIKALEEEVEGLKGELQDAEAANDELNEELQTLQEQLLASSGDGTSGTDAAGSGKGDKQRSAVDDAAQAALKEELAEAMAMCEELDQTVTDLTDELHSKDQQRAALEARLAELEREVERKTQVLEDKIAKAKSETTTLAAKLADSSAELRASNGRLQDASDKALAAQGREEGLLEKNASLRERLSELTTAASDLANAAAARESQLEESLTASEEARVENARLQDEVGHLSARVEEETSARLVAEQAAADRQAELLAATRAAAAPAPLPAARTDADPGATTAASGGTNSPGGRQGEGQSSGETGVVDGAGTGGDGESLGAIEKTSAKETELRDKVARLERALREASRGAGGSSADAAGFSVAAALESENVDDVKAELKGLVDLYERERVTNASLLSKIRALRGNIEVVCRIRPPTAEETGAGVPIALEALGDGEVGVRRSNGGAASWRSFALDKAFGPRTTQEEVFRQVEPLALSAADGMNACIFAYGQTGSGKTHTMIGDAKGGEMAGVSYRTMNKLFQVLEMRRAQQPDYTFTVKVAMLEIYNEEVRDLLSSSDGGYTHGSGSGGHGHGHGSNGGPDGFGDEGVGKLEIRRDQEGMVQVPGLTHVTVSSADEVLTLLERGGGARAVAATGVHDHSSRSHSVLMAEVACRAGPDDLPATGRLFLVDLAGSERIKVSGVTGAGLREATSINSSLSALGDVMQALDQKQKHVPYRNSKLTFLLQDALGGNSKTAMVVTVCPTSNNVEETLFALQFAARARNVSLGPAQRNVGAKNLLEEGKDLRAKLREAGRRKEQTEEALSTLQREHARSQQKMAALLESRTKNVGELRNQLEQQIESLKSQLDTSQASLLAERNKRMSLQSQAEDTERQLKRSMAKVTALGRDREEREAKLRAKQEEVGELKAELRKVVSEAKNTVRRLSAGRTSTGSGSFGFKARGGDGDDIAPGKSGPHTPSQKLSEAKTRYTRIRQSTPGRMRAPGAEAFPSQIVTPPSASDAALPTAESKSSRNSLDTRSIAADLSAVGVSPAQDGRSAGSAEDELAVSSEPTTEKEDGNEAGGRAAAEPATQGSEPPLARTQKLMLETVGSDDEAIVTTERASDDVAEAIARATASFAKATPRALGGRKSELRSTCSGSGSGPVSGGSGSGSVSGASDRRASLSARSKSNRGSVSNLMKPTASSTSRLRLSALSAADEVHRMDAPRSSRLSGATPGVTPRESPSRYPASPASSRLARPNSFNSTAAARTRSSGPLYLRTPRGRNSIAGSVGAAAAAAAAAAEASGSMVSNAGGPRRRATMQPPSPAHGAGPRMTTGGWLGEKSRASGTVGGSTMTRAASTSRATGSSAGDFQASARASSATRGAGGTATSSTSAGTGMEKRSEPGLSRAQIALERHQARMDRIREKRQQRMGAKDISS